MNFAGMCTSKTILGFIGLLFFVSGLASVIMGGLAVSHNVDVSNIVQKFNFAQVPAVILIFVGIIFFVAGICGCCNLFKENKGCLASFFIFLLIIVSMMMAAIILGSVYKKDINATLGSTLNATLDLYSDSDNETRAEVDALQKYFQCCGIQNFTDWFHTPYGHVPDSCATNTTKSGYFNIGCYSKIKQFFDANFGYIISGTVVLLIILILGMICSCALFWYKRDENYFTLS